jgi:hypothetical protein
MRKEHGMSRTNKYTSATEWGVGYEYGAPATGILEMVEAMRLRKETPVTLLVSMAVRVGGKLEVIRHPEYDGLTFIGLDAAERYAVEAGLLEVFKPRGFEVNQGGLAALMGEGPETEVLTNDPEE